MRGVCANVYLHAKTRLLCKVNDITLNTNLSLA